MVKEGKIRPRDYAFDSEGRKVFELLKDQFDSPAKAMRELIQNSLGANAERIYIDSSYENGLLKLLVEDDGDGMTPKERDEKLLRMGNYGKEGDPEVPGEYGFGFHSVFAYDPQSVIVESRSDDCYAWRAQIDKKGEGQIEEGVDPCLDNLDPREDSYTKIQLIIEVDGKAEAQRIIKEARAEIVQSCQHVEAPVFFEGRCISQGSFDLIGPRVRYSDSKGREAVIARDKTGGGLELFSHKIKVGEMDRGEIRLPYGYRIILDDPNLNTVISRNDVRRDENLKRALSILRREVAGFNLKVVHYLENYLRENLDDLSKKTLRDTYKGIKVGELYRYVSDFLRGKIEEVKSQRSFFTLNQRVEDIIAEDILEADLFIDIDKNLISLRGLMDRARRGPLLFAARPSRITDRFGAAAQIIRTHHPAVETLLDRIGGLGGFPTPIDVNAQFFTPPIPEKLRGAEESYLRTLKELEGVIGRTRLELAQYDPEEEIGEESDIYATPYRWQYVDREDFQPGSAYRYFVLLNRNHRSIQDLIRLHSLRPEQAKRLTALKVAATLEEEFNRDFLGELIDISS